MGIIAAVGAAASIGGDIFSGVEASKANEQQQYQLQLQMQQTKARAAQDSIERSKKEQQIRATALAMQGASGMTLSSGNYQNAQEQSYKTFVDDNQIANVNLMDNLAGIQSRMDAANMNYHTQLFGDAMNIAETGANLYAPEEREEKEQNPFEF